MVLLQADSSVFKLVDIDSCNPWWGSSGNLPTPIEPRADFGRRVQNAQNEQLVIIPGPPGTGKTETLHQTILALTKGEEYQYASVVDNRVDLSTPIDVDNLCYIPCDDPLARFVDGFIAASVDQFLEKRSGDPFYIFLDSVHRLPEWRTQLDSAINDLAADFPDVEWHVVATVSSTENVNESDFGTEAPDASVYLDSPHLSQKFRDALLTSEPFTSAADRIYDAPGDEDHALGRARTAFKELATGSPDGDPDKLVDHLEEIRDAVLNPPEADEEVTVEDIRKRVDRYLLTGGFEPAMRGQTDSIEHVHEHVLNGLEATVYREIPQLVKVEDSLNRIEEPRDLNAVATYLARRGYEETSYSDLSGTFNRDSRTIKEKYTNMLRRFSVIAKSTRCGLQRERTVRFFFRSPGYVSALLRGDPLETRREDLVRTTIADHLHRSAINLVGNYSAVEYWRTDDALVDFALETEVGTTVPFVSAFASDPRSTTDAFENFVAIEGDENKDVEVASLEVVLDDVDCEITASDGVAEESTRFYLPHWILFLMC